MLDEHYKNARIVFETTSMAPGASCVLLSRGLIWTLDGEGEWIEHLMDGVFRPLHVWVRDPDAVTVDQILIGPLLYLASPLPARYAMADAVTLGLVRPDENVEVRCSVTRSTILQVELRGTLLVGRGPIRGPGRHAVAN